MRCVTELVVFFFFNDTATTEIYTLSLHDALPICGDSPVFLDYLVLMGDLERRESLAYQDFLVSLVEIGRAHV